MTNVFFLSQLLQKTIVKTILLFVWGVLLQNQTVSEAILEYFIVPTHSLPYDQNTSFHNLCSPVLRLIKEMLETVAVQWKETSRETQPQTLVLQSTTNEV